MKSFADRKAAVAAKSFDLSINIDCLIGK